MMSRHSLSELSGAIAIRLPHAKYIYKSSFKSNDVTYMINSLQRR